MEDILSAELSIYDANNHGKTINNINNIIKNIDEYFKEYEAWDYSLGENYNYIYFENNNNYSACYDLLASLVPDELKGKLFTSNSNPRKRPNQDEIAFAKNLLGADSISLDIVYQQSEVICQELLECSGKMLYSLIKDRRSIDASNRFLSLLPMSGLSFDELSKSEWYTSANSTKQHFVKEVCKLAHKILTAETATSLPNTLNTTLSSHYQKVADIGCSETKERINTITSLIGITAEDIEEFLKSPIPQNNKVDIGNGEFFYRVEPYVELDYFIKKPESIIKTLQSLEMR